LEKNTQNKGICFIGELLKFPNIYNVTENQLNEIGIKNIEYFKEIESRESLLYIKEINFSVCFKLK